MNDIREAEEHDFSDVEVVLLDYFGVQAKAWMADEMLSIQNLLGHQYSEDDQPAVDPKLRRLYDTADVQTPEQFLRKAVAAGLGLGEITEQKVQEFQKVLQRERCCTALFRDTYPTLVTLRNMGLRLGVISDIPVFSVEHLFYGPDYHAKYFEHLALSCQVGSIKEEGKIFNRAAEMFSVTPSQCLVVDDGLQNVLAAKAAGCKAILIDRQGKTQETLPGIPKICQLTELLEMLPVRR